RGQGVLDQRDPKIRIGNRVVVHAKGNLLKVEHVLQQREIALTIGTHTRGEIQPNKTRGKGNTRLLRVLVLHLSKLVFVLAVCVVVEKRHLLLKGYQGGNRSFDGRGSAIRVLLQKDAPEIRGRAGDFNFKVGLCNVVDRNLFNVDALMQKQ